MSGGSITPHNMIPKYPRVFVQLTGEDGNAFFIIGAVTKALRRAGVDKPERDAFLAEATAVEGESFFIAECFHPLIGNILQQVNYADRRYGPFTSSHEGLGVLMEEVSELVEAIRRNNIQDIEEEATQVSAVAMRLAYCCSDEGFQARSVK